MLNDIIVLSKDFVEDAVKILVTRFIPLNPADLDNWMADPEEWVNAEEKENDQWEFELRVRTILSASLCTRMNETNKHHSALWRASAHDACCTIPSIRTTSHRDDLPKFGWCVTFVLSRCAQPTHYRPAFHRSLCRHPKRGPLLCRWSLRRTSAPTLF